MRDSVASRRAFTSTRCDTLLGEHGPHPNVNGDWTGMAVQLNERERYGHWRGESWRVGSGQELSDNGARRVAASQEDPGPGTQ